jgi:hypothetical protein
VTRFQNRAGTRSRVHVRCLLACALAILCCASACDTGSAASGRSSNPAAGTGAVSRRTPATALEQWLKLVVRGDYHAACQDSVPPPGSIHTPVPVPANACSSKSSRELSVLTILHGNFSIDGITPRTPITVASTPARGAKAAVPGTDIHVSGTTLTALMVAHSTGLRPGELDLSFTLLRARGAWYVVGFNINV